MAMELPKQDNPGTPIQVGRRIFIAGLLVATAGCQNFIKRGQSPDIPEAFAKYSQKEFDKARYIHEVCAISGLTYKEIHGIGLWWI